MFRPLLSAALAAVVATALTACSGDEPDDSDAPPSETPTSAAAPAVPTTAVIGRVTGRLAKARRAPLRTSVTQAVDAWIDAAYVGGEYPRSDFGDAFTSFSPGARTRATQDRALMSNAGIGERVDAVEVITRRVRIDVLAPQGRPAGVTAEVGLGLRFTGDLQRRDRIAGRLYLTKVEGRWTVFGYDMRRGQVR